MNKRRVLKSVAAGLCAVVGVTAAQAETRIWTGESAENNYWTTPGNWEDGNVPTASDAALINSADNIVIDVAGSEESPNVGSLVIGNGGPVNFSGAKRLYTSTDDSTFGEGAVVTVTGVDNPGTDDKGEVENASVIVRGVSNTLGTGFSAAVSGEGSKLRVENAVMAEGGSYTFNATDGGVVETTAGMENGASMGMNLTYNATNANAYLSFGYDGSGNRRSFTLNGGSLTMNLSDAYSSMQAITVNKGCQVKIDMKNAATKFTSAYIDKGGSVVKLDNSSLKTDWGVHIAPGNSSATFEMRGENPYVRFSGGGLTIGTYATVKLTPELSWDQKAADSAEEVYPLFGSGSTQGDIKFAKDWKCTVDVSKFARFYGVKKILVASVASTASRQFYSPQLTVVGEGAENCSVSFSTDKAWNTYNLVYLTIDAQNPLEGEIVKVEQNGVKTYFESLAEAVAAANEGAVITPLADLALDGTVCVNKPITLNLASFTVTGDGVSDALNVVEGGALTIEGEGTINGGDKAAVAVTGGAFTMPFNSGAKLTSQGDALVVTNAGADPAVEILDGSFESTGDGSPVVSKGESEFEPIAGFMKGGVCNKQPASELIAVGYKVVEEEGLWKVVLDGDPVCKVKHLESERPFASLEAAYQAALDGDDIVLCAAIEDMQALTFDRGIKIWLVLNGFSIRPAEQNATLFVIESGEIVLHDGDSGNDPGVLYGGVVVNGGKFEMGLRAQIEAEPALTVNGGTASVKGDTSSGGEVVLRGGVVLTGGSLTLGILAKVAETDVAIKANGGTLKIEGGDYAGETSAFEAGEDFKSGTVSAGSFSSEIPSKFLAANRHMEEQDGIWVVMPIADEKAVTYTWKGLESGAWASRASWEADVTPNAGYPKLDKSGKCNATARFPSTLPEGTTEVLIDDVFELKDLKIGNENNTTLKLVFDNGKIVNGPSAVPVQIGRTGPAELVFKGENAQLKAQNTTEPSFDKDGTWYRMNFGQYESTALKFEVPQEAWTTNTAPILHTYKDAPIALFSKTHISVDAKNALVPGAGQSITNVLIYNPDGMRFAADTDDEVRLMKEAEIVNCPPGTKGEVVYVSKFVPETESAYARGGVCFILTKKPGFLILVK